jgi:hypothetical protein
MRLTSLQNFSLKQANRFAVMDLLLLHGIPSACAGILHHFGFAAGSPSFLGAEARPKRPGAGRRGRPNRGRAAKDDGAGDRGGSKPHQSSGGCARGVLLPHFFVSFNPRPEQYAMSSNS